MFSGRVKHRQDVPVAPSFRILKISVLLGAAAAFTYACVFAVTWLAFSRPKRRDSDSAGCKSALDRFLPTFDIRDFRQLAVGAPADIVFREVSRLQLESLAIVRCLFWIRERTLGAVPSRSGVTHPLIQQALLWGWAPLFYQPPAEIAFGSVTVPWRAKPSFEPLAGADFLRFASPGYVKIAWNVTVSSLSPKLSLVGTETRAIATDDSSRTRFRLYWSLAKPGIVLIRLTALWAVKQKAERQLRFSR